VKLFPEECLAAADNERNPIERLLSHALHLGLHNVSRFKLKLEMTDELMKKMHASFFAILIKSENRDLRSPAAGNRLVLVRVRIVPHLQSIESELFILLFHLFPCSRMHL
jgi:hypothetical protein